MRIFVSGVTLGEVWLVVEEDTELLLKWSRRSSLATHTILLKI